MQTVTSKDGTRIAYDQSGQGPALILTTGAAATRADAARVASALAPYFTVITYDRRGRGDSGDTQPYAVDREVEDIAALAEAAGGAAFLFGHSSGGILGLDAARLLPGKITKLAIYEPPFIIDDSHWPMPAGFIARLQALIAADRRGDAVELWMGNIGVPPATIAGMRQGPMWTGMEALAPSLVYDATIAEGVEQGDPEPLKKWASTAVPTLVMDGTLYIGSPEGHAFMRHGADELARIMPNARRQTLEGQDHGPADDVLIPALYAFYLD
jgi:pimeloyl-ACP methyl ester carboxylesterase